MNEEPRGEKREDAVCPYLGLCEDEATYAVYPDAANCCHRDPRPFPLRLPYQARFCLSADYQACPIYRHPAEQPLPKKLLAAATLPSKTSPTQKLWLAIGIVLLLILVGGYAAMGEAFPLWAWALPTATPTITPPPTESPTLTLTATLTPTNTLTPTFTPSPTDTPTLTPTPSPTPIPHTLETPLGPNGAFLIHRVAAGESWATFEERYHTSKAAILALNALPEDQMLWEGMVLVIPVGVSDPEDLEAFSLKAYEVEETTRVADLIQQLGVDAQTFEQLNLCSDEDILHAGDWVLLPRFLSSPTPTP